jgi:hypothetical protein
MGSATQVWVPILAGALGTVSVGLCSALDAGCAYFQRKE